MENTTTAGEVEMARRICARCAGDAGTINHPIAPRFLAGELDDHPAMVSALAAIIETTEAAAKLADDWAEVESGFGSTGFTHRNTARRLRNNDHLKGPQP